MSNPRSHKSQVTVIRNAKSVQGITRSMSHHFGTHLVTDRLDKAAIEQALANAPLFISEAETGVTYATEGNSPLAGGVNSHALEATRMMALAILDYYVAIFDSKEPDSVPMPALVNAAKTFAEAQSGAVTGRFVDGDVSGMELAELPTNPGLASQLAELGFTRVTEVDIDELPDAEQALQGMDLGQFLETEVTDVDEADEASE